MSNLFKSKSLLVFVVVSIMFVGTFTINTSKASASDTPCTITSTLKLGSKGAEVKCLQALVGASPVDGSFGKLTKIKVMAWQKSNDLTSDGVFGAKSQAKVNTSVSSVVIFTGSPCGAGALFNTTTGQPCSSSTVINTNGAGNLTSVTLDGSPSNVEVGEGVSDVGVLGFQIRADAGSDLNIQNVRVNLSATGTGSTWPSRYISNVSVWQGSTKVGGVDISNFSQNGNIYSATIPLSSAIVGANTFSDFKITVTSNTVIDSSDANNTFNVYVDSIRYKDTSGAILTTSMTGITEPIRFLKLLNSASVKLTLSEDTSNPKDRTVVANYTSLTSDVSLFKFNLKAEGSELWLGSLALPATAVGVTDANQISKYYKLKYNGRVISSFTDTQSGTTPLITFGDDTVPGSTLLDGSNASVDIPAGETASFEVTADIQPLCNGTSIVSPCTGVADTEFDAGDTLKVDFPSASLQSPDVYVENQVGDYLSESSINRTGSATGYNATFRVQGVTASYVGNTFSSTKNTTTGALTSETYTTTVNVSAVGNDFFINPVANYVPNTVLSTDQDGVVNTGFGFNLAVLNNANNYVTVTEVPSADVATSVTCSSGCIQESLSSMKIPSGTTATFVISTTLTNVAATPLTAGGYKVAIFSTNATDGTTLSAFANTPSYNFITPISPDIF